MNLTEYKPLALRTEKKFDSDIKRLIHSALGLITECGELCTVIKRVAIYGKLLDSPDDKGVTLRAHAGEEIADAMWYVAIGADVCGLVLDGLDPMPHTAPLRSLDLLGLDVGRAVGHIADMALFLDAQRFGHIPDSASGFLQNHFISVVQALGNVCKALDLDFGTLLRENIEKLQARFPDAYSDAAAEARADKGGLDARNS